MKKCYRLKRINGNPHPLDTHPKTFIRYRVVGYTKLPPASETRPNRRYLGKIEREHGKDVWHAIAFDGLRTVPKGKFGRRADAARAILFHFYPQMHPLCKSRDVEIGLRCQRLKDHGSERHWYIDDTVYATWENS